MAWHWTSTCSACAFVRSQLGTPTPCPTHAGMWYSAVDDQSLATLPVTATERRCERSEVVAGPDQRNEPAFGVRRPTVDRPGPFTLREYARLLLLRSRVQEQS